MSTLTEQPNWPPTRKVNAAAGGGAAGMALAVLLAIFVLSAEVAPESVAVLTGSLSTLGAFLFGYFFRERA